MNLPQRGVTACEADLPEPVGRWPIHCQVVDPYGLAKFGMTRVDETRW
ncbi:hypothetical protein [Xanthomonas arboricola]|nr:hypothetical protein [Xanthomonas arboricola]